MHAYIYTVYVERKMLKPFCVNVHLSLQCGGLFGMRVVASGVLFFSTPIAIDGVSRRLSYEGVSLAHLALLQKKTDFPSRR